MDFKNIKASQEAITRNITTFDELTGNLYETVAVLSKRSDQIASSLRQELVNQISAYSTPATVAGDGVDEICENREQIEVARYFEMLPKPTLIAVQEMLDGELCFRKGEKSAKEEKED